jgi:hypothetical protein
VEEMVLNRRHIYGKVSASEGEARFNKRNPGRRAYYVTRLSSSRALDLSKERSKDKRLLTLLICG